MRLEKIGDLECLRVPGEPGGNVVVLCHGFGANAYDLAPLAGRLKAPAGSSWVFPQAPLPLNFPGMQGRAWFPLVSDELARLLASGKKIEFAEVVPPGLDESREKFLSMIASLGSPPDRITIGGFSQGSMLATDVFLRSSEKFAGLVILSGTLICQGLWSEAARRHSPFQFFQSHGNFDPVLPFENAKRLETLLREGGHSGEFISFSGGHEIPENVLRRLNLYLMR